MTCVECEGSLSVPPKKNHGSGGGGGGGIGGVVYVDDVASPGHPIDDAGIGVEAGRARGEETVLCDGDRCDHSAHATCTGLSKEELRDEASTWFCRGCRLESVGIRRTGEEVVGTAGDNSTTNGSRNEDGGNGGKGSRKTEAASGERGGTSGGQSVGGDGGGAGDDSGHERRERGGGLDVNNEALPATAVMSSSDDEVEAVHEDESTEDRRTEEEKIKGADPKEGRKGRQGEGNRLSGKDKGRKEGKGAGRRENGEGTHESRRRKSEKGGRSDGETGPESGRVGEGEEDGEGGSATTDDGITDEVGEGGRGATMRARATTEWRAEVLPAVRELLRLTTSAFVAGSDESRGILIRVPPPLSFPPLPTTSTTTMAMATGIATSGTKAVVDGSVEGGQLHLPSGGSLLPSPIAPYRSSTASIAFTPAEGGEGSDIDLERWGEAGSAAALARLSSKIHSAMCPTAAVVPSSSSSSVSLVADGEGEGGREVSVAPPQAISGGAPKATDLFAVTVAACTPTDVTAAAHDPSVSPSMEAVSDTAVEGDGPAMGDGADSLGAVVDSTDITAGCLPASARLALLLTLVSLVQALAAETLSTAALRSALEARKAIVESLKEVRGKEEPKLEAKVAAVTAELKAVRERKKDALSEGKSGKRKGTPEQLSALRKEEERLDGERRTSTATLRQIREGFASCADVRVRQRAVAARWLQLSSCSGLGTDRHGASFYSFPGDGRLWVQISAAAAAGLPLVTNGIGQSKRGEGGGGNDGWSKKEGGEKEGKGGADGGGGAVAAGTANLVVGGGERAASDETRHGSWTADGETRTGGKPSHLARGVEGPSTVISTTVGRTAEGVIPGDSTQSWSDLPVVTTTFSTSALVAPLSATAVSPVNGHLGGGVSSSPGGVPTLAGGSALSEGRSTTVDSGDPLEAHAALSAPWVSPPSAWCLVRACDDIAAAASVGAQALLSLSSVAGEGEKDGDDVCDDAPRPGGAVGAVGGSQVLSTELWEHGAVGLMADPAVRPIPISLHIAETTAGHNAVSAFIRRPASRVARQYLWGYIMPADVPTLVRALQFDGLRESRLRVAIEAAAAQQALAVTLLGSGEKDPYVAIMSRIDDSGSVPPVRIIE